MLPLATFHKFNHTRKCLGNVFGSISNTIQKNLIETSYRNKNRLYDLHNNHTISFCYPHMVPLTNVLHTFCSKALVINKWIWYKLDKFSIFAFKSASKTISKLNND